MGVAPKPEFADPRPGDIRDSRADNSQAKAVLGFEPAMGFEEGLRRAVDWFAAREQPSPGR
jgi:nucleoside-diphosphate-sugar epimerase